MHPYSNNDRKYPRISRPVELLRPTYDVVVIGSGYGGAVAASRMARGRQTVCVLERGKERWPGEFPTTLAEAAPQVHISGTSGPDASDHGRHEHGDPTGLYHLMLGDGQNAFVGNGLGGTSLLNANIFLRADERTLALKYWPEEIWSNPSSLDKYYARAEEMLEPEPYPSTFPPLRKLSLLEQQAAQLDAHDRFYRPPQTTRFADGLNAAGVYMNKSTLSGQDSTGVNDGSKNSTLVTYLADAWNWGAELFCECEVRYVKKHPSGEGYLVFFAWHGGSAGASRDKFGPDVVYDNLMWVHARKMVFLGAGALGSTEIVLRSAQLGLKTSEYVGRDMSGNGDILAFGYNLQQEVNAVGCEDPDPSNPVGPTITGVIDLRDTTNPLDGFVIEEGAFPSALAHLLQPMLELSSSTLPSLSPKPLARRLKSKLFGPYARGGSVEHTQVYLVMSHDSNQATLTLDPLTSSPRLVWAGIGRAAHAAEISATLSQLQRPQGGTLVQSPFYALLGQAEITVHAIGGMNLGRATSHLGEVLDGDGVVYEGLCVVDGAVVPTALGVNPLATITALAERAVEGVAEKFGVRIDYETRNAPLDLFGKPRFPVQPPDDEVEFMLIRAREPGNVGTSIGFTERMAGFVHVGGEIEDYVVAAAQAKADLHASAFFLSVLAPDEDALLSRSNHPAMLTGTMTSALPGSPHMVTRGRFGLFTFDERAPDTRNLVYEFDMLGVDGRILHFSGYKVVNNAASFSPRAIWEETSTLYVTVTRGSGSSREVVGRGVMNIKAHDFVSELETVAVTGASTGKRLRGLGRFGTFFAKQLARTFFAPFAPLIDTNVASGAFAFMARPVPSERFTVTASDGVISPMQCWEPSTSNGYNILLIPGASVDERIFALPTIPVNAIEYFTRAGYRCYCVVTRIGYTPNSRLPETNPYNARLDVYAALKEVVKRSGGERAYVVAHCVGSLALACGLLDGTIPGREWIRGLTVSQLFMHPILGSVNKVKARLPATSAYALLTQTKYLDCVPQNQPGFTQRALDQLLRFYPVGPRKEICSSATCHRTELAFGRCWNHANLNTATHDRLGEYFGGIKMATLKQLAAMGRAGVVLRADGVPLVAKPGRRKPALTLEVVDPALERLRGIPIMLFSGADNVVFTPEGTDATYSLLRDTFGAEMYERVLFQGRGHLDSWMSASCADKGSVFETVLRHANGICRPRALKFGEDGFEGGRREVVPSPSI